MLKANVLVLCALAGTIALGENHDPAPAQFKGVLTGYNEVPSVLTTGSGQFTIAVASDQKSLSVTLQFTTLAGVAQSAGLYLGLPGTTGAIIASICGGSKPACPTTADGSVAATISSGDVDAIAAQGLVAGDLASVIQALVNGAVYVNVITNKFPNGEVRGQVVRGFGFGRGRVDN
jgi:hypothetical protein